MSDNGTPGKNRFGTRLVVRMLHTYFRFSRSMTIGVRAACFDADGRVFLVRHTYLPGWYLPGGGVERHETVPDALRKELREEGNLEIEGPLRLFHVYFNRQASRRDHVLLYRVQVRQTAPRGPDREIAECGFFDLNDLPPDTTAATRRRLRELEGQEPPADHW